ncbi:hypothetical protein CDD81_5646 [Ophiocordyceps australis]|uniref:Nucleoporin Nup133/Nup155-like N-terminal domain-containing protein n=1 Tax=Ophiocordyceps australis TaxID=1399860 RepID=A0A2C5Y2E6_9HYPO|nr:hypothetical protein CDD81_5646 [Ophiocordyceps australis]
MAFPPTTPQRPVPGAFLNTPAVVSRYQGGPDAVRRSLFPVPEAGNAATADQSSKPKPPPSSSENAIPPAVASKTASATTPSAVPRPENLSPATKAAKAIDSFLKLDASFPDLDTYCKQGASSDYDLSTPESCWAPFQKTHMYPIPNQIFNQYDSSQLQTIMGLFAEINHAWVVIDNCLFLWDYTRHDPELIGFEEQPQTIHSVALVPPKPGIFVNTITHILVVATSSEMILLGVSTADTPAGTKSVSLYQTKMSLAIRGNDVRIITGTDDGRIFFGGCADTDVSELFYQSEERWFSNRCGRINHSNPGWSSVVTLQAVLWRTETPEHLIDIVVDSSRRLLYTLSSKSTIRTYHMDAPNRLVKIITKEKVDCLRDITHMITSSVLLTDASKIVSLSSISKLEASKLHLMALTDTGCRLFFSATSASSYLYGSSDSMVPQSMQVQYIKFPPSQAPRSSTAAPNAEPVVDMTSKALVGSRQGLRFPPGYFLDLMHSENNANTDLLFVSGPDTGRIKRSSPTQPVRYYEQGSWLDIGSRAEAIGLVTKPFAATSQPAGFGNELAVQFDEPSSEFAVLTNTGIHVIRRRRLVDTFAAAIRDSPGDEAIETVTRRLIQLYGRVEVVSTALAVACGNGGDVRSNVARAKDQMIEVRAKSLFIDFGSQPSVSENDGMTLTVDSVKLSARHDALALYISRLVRKLWNTLVVKSSIPPGGGITVDSVVPLANLVNTQENIEHLRNFLESNRGLIQGMSGPPDAQAVASQQEEVALQAEHQALHALQKLLESISEGISFVLMLFDERVSEIFTRLDETTRGEVTSLTYEKLFSQTEGKELAKVLVKAIVNRNIESGSNVETVADALRRRCGSFCSAEDVVVFKAQEQLKLASEKPTTVSRSLLHESLKLFEKVAGSLSPSNLQSTVQQYVALKYYAGAIQLCLVVARERDRGNSALMWVSDGKPDNDPRVEAFNKRKRCYDMIYEVLQQLDVVSSQEPEIVDGKPSLMVTKKIEAYDVVNNSDDELFHYDLYRWYLEHGWIDRILATDSPHVIKFLQDLAGMSVEHANLLCRFYTSRNRFFDAAQVQADLAYSNFALGIKERIKLLSLAKANASVATIGVSRQEQQYLTHQVGETLDIGNVQDDLLGRLLADERLDAGRKEEVTQVLDGRILSLSDLFNNYADQANYYDLCLLMYHLANYRNPSTILTTWTSLIEQIHDEVMSRRARVEEGAPPPPLPYEAVSGKIQNIAHRTSLDSFVFPIENLVPELCRYALVNQQDGTIGADPSWPIQLFLVLGVSHDMLLRVLEGVFETQDYGFSGMARNRIIEMIVYLVNDWVAEMRRRGGNGKGVSVGPWVGDLLTRCEQALPPPGQGSNPGGADLADVRRVLRTLRREVSGLIERVPTGSLRF